MKTILILFAAGLLATPLKGASVNLAWDASTSSDVVSYNIRVGIQSGQTIQSYSAGNALTYTVPGLNYGTTYYFTATAVAADGIESLPSNEVVYTPIPPAPDKIRYHPRLPESGFNSGGARMVGGIFEGATNINGPYVEIHKITASPLGWVEAQLPAGTLAQYRYLRYRGPDGSWGNVAEIEFYRSGVKLTGIGFGTPGSWHNNGNTFPKALDGSINTRFDGPVINGVFVGIDAGP